MSVWSLCLDLRIKKFENSAAERAVMKKLEDSLAPRSSQASVTATPARIHLADSSESYTGNCSSAIAFSRSGVRYSGTRIGGSFPPPDGPDALGCPGTSHDNLATGNLANGAASAAVSRRLLPSNTAPCNRSPSTNAPGTDADFAASQDVTSSSESIATPASRALCCRNAFKNPDGLREKCALLDALHHRADRDHPTHDSLTILHRLLRSFPSLLPTRRDGVVEKTLSRGENRGREELGALQNRLERRERLIDLVHGVVTARLLELHERVHRRCLGRAGRGRRGHDPRVRSLELIPRPQQRAQSRGPRVAVESAARARGEHHRAQRRDHVLTVRHLNHAVHVHGQGEQRRRVRLVQRGQRRGEVRVVRRVRQSDVRPRQRPDARSASASHLVAKELLQVRSQHEDVVVAVHPPAPVKLRPLRFRAVPARLVDDVRAAPQVGEGKLVKFRPPLRHVRAALLNDRVEPREQKQELSAQWAPVGDVLLRPRLVRPAHVAFQPGRGFVRDLQATLQERRRELRVRLGREEQTKVRVRFQDVNLLLERGQPRDDEMEILKAEPVAVSRAIHEQPHRLLGLPLPHRELMVPSVASRFQRVLFELLARIRPGGHDEQRRRGAARFLAHPRERERRRRDRLDAELVAHERSHRGLEAVRSQRLHEEQPHERLDVDPALGDAGLRRGGTHPFAPHRAVVESVLGDDRWERGDEVLVSL
eukprot:30294-Pelagococcus_subviridis.AAC.71